MAAPRSSVVLLDKAGGESSFSALSELKRHFNTRKVGHTGTLDPMATGLIVALVGPATRCARFFSSLDKTYTAGIRFGAETDSDDRTGQVTRTADPPSLAEALTAARAIVGEIDQVPPAYSAIHIDGKRAYRRARDGETVEMPTRRVTVHEIFGEPVDDDTLRLTVRCSSGTYIRSLARDLGRATGSAAHLVELRRTAVGPFTVDEIQSSGDGSFCERELGPALLRLPEFSELPVDLAVARLMWDGGRVAAAADKRQARGWILASCDGAPVSIGRWEDGLFRYEVVFPRTEIRDD